MSICFLLLFFWLLFFSKSGCTKPLTELLTCLIQSLFDHFIFRFYLYSGAFLLFFCEDRAKKYPKMLRWKKTETKIKGDKKNQQNCVCHADMFTGRPFRPVSESCSTSKQWGWGTSSSTYHNKLVTLKGGSNSPPTRHCILSAHSFFSRDVFRGCALSAYSRYEQFTIP